MSTKYWTDAGTKQPGGGWFLLALILWAMLAAWVLSVKPAAQEGAPRFPARGVEIIDAMLKLPGHQTLAKGTDTQRRELTKRIIEQFICEFPDEGWTWKSASSSRPPSKDGIARLIKGRLFGWDWQNGSSRQRQVRAGAVAEEWEGQHPIPLSCVPWLKVGGTPTPTPPSPPPCPPVPSCPLCPPDVRVELNQCREEVDDVRKSAQEMEARLRREVTDLKRRLEGVTCTPGRILGIRGFHAGCKVNIPPPVGDGG